MSTISCYKKSLAHLLYRRYAKTSAFLVRPTGLEPAALRVGVLRSIRMSYERNYLLIISILKKSIVTNVPDISVYGELRNNIFS